MPCSDGREPWISHPNPNEDKLIAENVKLTERCNLNARIACEALRRLENYLKVSDTPSLSDELKDWWVKHKKLDDKRMAKERERARRKLFIASALSKLTPEEREALGLKDTGGKDAV